MAGPTKNKQKTAADDRYFTKRRILFLILAVIIISSWIMSLVISI